MFLCINKILYNLTVLYRKLCRVRKSLKQHRPCLKEWILHLLIKLWQTYQKVGPRGKEKTSTDWRHPVYRGASLLKIIKIKLYIQSKYFLWTYNLNGFSGMFHDILLFYIAKKFFISIGKIKIFFFLHVEGNKLLISIVQITGSKIACFVFFR